MHIRFLSITLIFTMVGSVAAQPPIGIKKALEDAYRDSRTRREQLMSGVEKATTKDANIANTVAEYHIYRITHERKVEGMIKVQAEFEREIKDLMAKKNASAKRAFIDQLGTATVDAMKNVLARDLMKDPQAVLHAAQMLPAMAMLKQDNVNTYLISLIEDTRTHDAIRLHALKAFKESMPIGVQQELIPLGAWNLKDADQNAVRAREARNVTALTKFIERNVKTDNMNSDEIATLRFLRREAIVSLAAAGSPAVMALNKPTPTLSGPVATTLMKVVAKNGGISPPPTLPEKVEAAIGLCNMEYPFMPEYHGELGVNLVGMTLVEFANEYNKDWGNFALVGKGKLPVMPWKSDGKRFQAGIAQMAANAKNSSAEKSAKTLNEEAKSILTRIVTLNEIDVPSVGRLDQAVANLRPKTATPFRSLKSPAIP